MSAPKSAQRGCGYEYNVASASGNVWSMRALRDGIDATKQSDSARNFKNLSQKSLSSRQRRFRRRAPRWRARNIRDISSPKRRGRARNIPLAEPEWIFEIGSSHCGTIRAALMRAFLTNTVARHSMAAALPPHRVIGHSEDCRRAREYRAQGSAHGHRGRIRLSA